MRILKFPWDSVLQAPLFLPKFILWLIIQKLPKNLKSMQRSQVNSSKTSLSLFFLYKSSNNHFSRIGGLHAWNDFRMVFIRSTRSHAECYVGGRYGEYLVLATLHWRTLVGKLVSEHRCSFRFSKWRISHGPVWSENDFGGHVLTLRHRVVTNYFRSWSK